MEKYEVFASDFYQNYSKTKLRLYRKRLDMLETFIDHEDLEGALNCVTEEPYNTVPEFAFYRINILIRLKRFEEAYEVASDQLFINFRPVQTQKKGLEYYFKLLKEYEVSEKNEHLDSSKKSEEKNVNDPSEEENHGFKESVLTAEVRLLTKIHVGIIKPLEIEESNLDDFKKIIMMTCYYDKFNRSAGAKYLKRVRNNFEGEQRKTINKLMSSLENKKVLNFNIKTYEDLLNAGICWKYAKELINEEEKILESPQKAKNEKPVEVVNVTDDNRTEKNTKVKKSNIIMSHPIKKDSVTNSINEQVLLEDSNVNEKAEITIKKPLKKTIEEVFPYETDIIRRTLYCLMNMNMKPVYVTQFDNFDLLVKKSINNIKALEKFERVVLQCSKYVNMKLSYNETKFKDLKKQLFKMIQENR